MSSSTTDRRLGLNGNTAIKAPCLVATTANITLSGEQTIDGVAVIADDRVLVKDQTDQSTNGIYDVSTGSWTRSLDFDGNLDIVHGTLVTVLSGSSNIDTCWRVITSDPITIGSSNIVFGAGILQSGSVISVIDSGTNSLTQPIQDVVRDAPISSFFYINGTGDQHSQLQNFLDRIAGKCGETSAGTYELDSSLTIHSGTYWRAKGGGTIILKAGASLSLSSTLLINATTTGTVNTYYDSDIYIEGIVFDGNNISSRTNALVAFLKAQGITLRRVTCRNNSYQGMAFSGNSNVVIDNCRFTGLGNPVVTAEGGPCIWIGDASDTSPNYYFDIGNSYFYNNEWAAIYPEGQNMVIHDNNISNCKESGIFIGGAQNFIDISNNVIVSISKKYISSAGIEAGSNYTTITGNTIYNTWGDCISLTDNNNVTITGNTLATPNQDPGGGTASCVTILAVLGTPRYITITGNTMQDGTGLAYAAVRMNKGASGSPIADLTISGNLTMADSSWVSGNTIQIDSGSEGNNWNVDRVSRTFTLTATGMTTSPTGTCTYTKVANTVTLDVPTISGTSNATTFTLTGLPSDLYPTASRQALIRTTDNGGSNTIAICTIDSSGVISLYKDVTGSAFTSSGTKSVRQSTISYPI